MPLTEDQRQRASKNYGDAREAAGLSRMIDDEPSLRLLASVIATSLERRRQEEAERLAAGKELRAGRRRRTKTPEPPPSSS
jgi:hypothetical protein